MSKRVNQLTLAKAICKALGLRRKNAEARTLSRREMLAVLGHLTVQQGAVEDLQARILEREKKRGRKPRSKTV